MGGSETMIRVHTWGDQFAIDSVPCTCSTCLDEVEATNRNPNRDHGYTVMSADLHTWSTACSFHEPKFAPSFVAPMGYF